LEDRYQRSSDRDIANVGGYYDFNGITEIHSGVELELNAKPLPRLSVNAMLSIGNWIYEEMLIATDLMLITPIDGGTFNHFVLRSSKSW
jgi:hypothetical protein